MAIRVARWSSRAARWSNKVARWIIRVARWSSRVARGCSRVARWCSRVARWSNRVARWLLADDLFLYIGDFWFSGVEDDHVDLELSDLSRSTRDKYRPTGSKDQHQGIRI